MTLVVGATGHLGTEIVRRLTATGRHVRALIRATSDPGRAAALRDLGAALTVGDLRNGATLADACRGVDTVITTATCMRSRQPGDDLEVTDRDGQGNLVEAARDAGIARFIYVSFSGHVGLDDPLTIAKRGVEAHIRESGMMWTILRPTFFTEVWLSPALGFDYPNATATIYGSGLAPISWISMFDVANFAVRVIDDPAAANTTIELGGPAPLAPLDVVRLFERISERPFTLTHVPEDALRAKYEAATSFDRTMAALMLSYARGDIIPMEETLERFPMTLADVEDYARTVLAGTPVH